MSAISRHLVLSAILFLALLPSASAVVTISDTELEAGETLSFSGSMHVLDCTNGNANLRMLLKEPAGGYVQIHPEIRRKETLHGRGQHTYRSISFEFQGFLHINESWPTGEYELMADGYYHCTRYGDMPVTWMGDEKESVKFTVSGDGPGKGWVQSSGRYVNSFQLDEIRQTDLVVSAHQSADCWVNGQQAAKGVSSQKRIDITPYLHLGSNEVSCRVNAGYEKVCSLGNGGSCGCSCWSKYRFCGQSTWFWDCPSNVQKSQTQFYVVAIPSFDAVVAQHRPEDILWSNGNSRWHYSRLPVMDGTMFLDRPDYYSSDAIYQGPTPWSSGRAYFSKWFQSGEAEAILAASSLLEPDCTLNGGPVAFGLVDSDWWVFQANVSLEEQNRILCTVERNGEFNLFDLAILEPAKDEPVPVVPAGSPFHYSSGESGELNTSGQWFSRASAGFAAAAGNAGKGLSGLPVAPIGVAAIASAGAVGLSSHLTRKRKVPKGSSPRFWERVGRLRQRFLKRKRKEEEFNRNWSGHLESVRRYWKAKDASRQRQMIHEAIQRVTALLGNGMMAASVNATVPAGLVLKEAMDLSLNQSAFSGLAVNQGTATIEEMAYSEYYGGVDGMIREMGDRWEEYREDVWKKTVFVGKEERNTAWGGTGAALSFYGYMTQEAGEITYAVGVGFIVAGMVLVEAPPVAAALGSIGGTLSMFGGVGAATGIFMRTVGDAAQGYSCHESGNGACTERSKIGNTNNMVDAALELLMLKGGGKMVSAIMKGGKSMSKRVMTKKLKKIIKKNYKIINEENMEKIVEYGLDIMKDEGLRMFREK